MWQAPHAKKTLSGSELVIDKGFPSSWVEKWKWWLEQDTYRNGPGSLNKFSAQCIMGVAMISPAPADNMKSINMTGGNRTIVQGTPWLVGSAMMM